MEDFKQVARDLWDKKKYYKRSCFSAYWKKFGQQNYFLNIWPKKSSNLFCWKGGGREKGKIGVKGLYFCCPMSKNYRSWKKKTGRGVIWVEKRWFRSWTSTADKNLIISIWKKLNFYILLSQKLCLNCSNPVYPSSTGFEQLINFVSSNRFSSSSPPLNITTIQICLYAWINSSGK